MRYLILTCLMSFVFSCVNAQIRQSSPNSSETMRLLCHKWGLITMSSQGKVANISAEDAMYLTFRIDGSYTDSSARFRSFSGTWAYDNKSALLSTSVEGGRSKTKLVEVTQRELVIELEYPTVT